MLRQFAIVTLLGLRGLKARLWQSLVIVVGMACVIGVLLSMLSLVEGRRRAIDEITDPRGAIIVAKGNQWEAGSGTIPVGQARITLNAPGIAKAADGAPLADFSFLTGVPGLSAVDGSRSYIGIRGMGPKGPLLREVRLKAGRMFRPGTHEFIAGERMQSRLQNTGLGDKVIIPDGEWPIVGIYADNPHVAGLLLGDLEPVTQTMRRNAYHSVLVRLDSPDAYPAFRRAIIQNPVLAVDVHRLDEWNVRSIADTQKFAQVIIYGISVILALGALFGCLNTMVAAVDSRKREIATLRALGYGTAPVIVSVLAEAVLLCIAGALIGAALAWALYDGTYSDRGGDAVTLAVSPAMVGLALLWAIGVAFLGGILPSIRAARWTVADALRAR